MWLGKKVKSNERVKKALKEASNDADPELKKRATEALETIEKS